MTKIFKLLTISSSLMAFVALNTTGKAADEARLKLRRAKTVLSTRVLRR